MSDFRYQLQPLNPSAPFPSGQATFDAGFAALLISPIAINGNDYTTDLRRWETQRGSNKVLLPATLESTNENLDLLVWNVQDSLDAVGNVFPCLVIYVNSDQLSTLTGATGVISLEFGLKPLIDGGTCDADNPCPEGFVCTDGRCEALGGPNGELLPDDLLLISDGGVIYKVRAGDYLNRAQGKTAVVVRNGVAYNCPAIGANILDTDTFPVWRPSAKKGYALTGKKFKNAFT